METELDGISEEEEEKFEMSPEEATNPADDAKPGVLNRKKVLIALCVSFAVIVCGGLLLNTLKPEKKTAGAEAPASAYGGSSSEFVSSLRDRAVNRRASSVEAQEISFQQGQPEYEDDGLELLPPVSFNGGYGVESVRPSSVPAQNQYPAPVPQSPPPSQGYSNTQPQQTPTYYRSPLVPSVQGGFYAQNAPVPQPVPSAAQPQNPAGYFSDVSRNAPSPAASYGNQASGYESQNGQQNKQSFSESSNNSGAAGGGGYLGDNALWTGTVIPGILITAINTDLPGNVLARVTQNIYDSQTGRSLLIPQGTVLVARYNSSVSYAQNRVQIVWDTIIRPDGFQLDLGGAGGADRAGMSGQAGTVNENWFEYLKAAGIIALFSVASSKMAESAAAAEESASNAAASGAGVVNQLGGNIISRALDIQPTLTVDSGTLINVMLNKTLYLPPAGGSPATQRYILE